MNLNEMDFGVVTLIRFVKGPDSRVDFCVSDCAPPASDTKQFVDYFVGNYSSASFYIVTRLSNSRRGLDW
jgi:hypothetical protein